MVEESFNAEMKPASAGEAGGVGGGGGKTGKPNDDVKKQGLNGCKKKKKRKHPNKAKSKGNKKKVSGTRDDDSSSSDSEAVEHTADSTSEDEEDDSDDSDSDSSSQALSDSEPEVELVRKPKGLKKRQCPKKTQQQRKTKSAKATKKAKKQLKSRVEVDSDDGDSDLVNENTDSDLDEEDESEVDGARPGRASQDSLALATMSQQLQQITQLQLKQQQQLDQLQRIVTASSLGGMGNAGGLYNPLAANAGLFNQGLLGNSPNAMGLAGPGQQNAIGAGSLAGSPSTGRGGARGAGRDLALGGGGSRTGLRSRRDILYDDEDDDIIPGSGRGNGNSLPGSSKHGKRGGADSSPKGTPKLEFKRVDQVWDSQIHNYKLQDTAKNTGDAHYNEYLFHVRRTFDWENKFKATVVDIKSKKLRECLQEVIGTVKGVSLVEDTPKLDPNMLFL